MPTVLKSAKVLLDGYDLSGNFNSLELPLSVDMHDVTVFTTEASPTRKFKAGLSMARFSAHGFWDSPTPDSPINSLISADDTVVSVYPDGITEGSTSTGSGYAFKSVVATYTPTFRVGDVLGFDISAEGRGVSS